MEFVELNRVMVITVKYSQYSYTVSSGRFTYEDIDGERFRDSKRFNKNGEPIQDRVIKYLESRNMKVVGFDGSTKNTDYFIVEPTDGTFKSVSGEFEKRTDV